MNENMCIITCVSQFKMLNEWKRCIGSYAATFFEAAMLSQTRVQGHYTSVPRPFVRQS